MTKIDRDLLEEADMNGGLWAADLDGEELDNVYQLTKLHYLTSNLHNPLKGRSWAITKAGKDVIAKD